jgi:hypothetical protein
MRIIALFIALMALSAVAFAEKKKDSNVYDEFRQLPTAASNVTVDDEVTALIKRRMANLLYPVDMSSLVPPDKDPKFHDLITVLQQQMGDPPTGVLTEDEFGRLSEASDNIDGNLIGLPLGKHVSVVDSAAVSAEGAGAWEEENGSRPKINFVRIFCFKARGMCEKNTAWLC